MFVYKTKNRVVFLSFVCHLFWIVCSFDINRLNLPSDGKLWALLVAGSNGYDNYRHQADICHAYQILHKHGIPDEQIVVMMYDDIAYNEENPTKGIIINHPNGSDVYQGTIKDYTKEQVTPKNFLNILQGDQKAMKGKGSGKVINSGPSDHIFVYFADHGAPGLLAFPEGELHAKQLNEVLHNMYKMNKFSKMVLYIEACESGSMFAKLLRKDIDVFATTAANPKESSYACYFDDLRQTYLGDVYSVKWMEDSDKENLNKETIKKQFQIVKKETNTSHVKEYGNVTISNFKVGEFQGSAACNCDTRVPEAPLEAVPAFEAPLMRLKRKLQNTNSLTEHSSLKTRLHKVIRNREFLKNTVKSIVDKATFTKQQAEQILNDQYDLEDFDCYEKATSYFSQNCFSLSKNDYALRQLYTLVNMCETGISAQKQIQAMDAVCIYPPMYGIV